MAYPTSYDTFTPPGPTLDTPPHATLHTELSGRLSIIQQTLGLTPQGGAATVDARLDAVEVAAGGAGAWTGFAYTVGNVSTGVGNVVARYRRLQEFTCAVRYEFNFGSGSAITGAVTANVPFAPKTGSLHAASYTAVRFGLSPRSGGIYMASDGILHFSSQYNGSGVWDASGPLSAGLTGDQLVFTITYETQAALS